MARLLRRTVAAPLAAAAMALAACGAGADGGGDALDGSATVAADAAPPVGFDPASVAGDAEALDGSTFELSSLRGQDYVVWFWAPW